MGGLNMPSYAQCHNDLAGPVGGSLAQRARKHTLFQFVVLLGATPQDVIVLFFFLTLIMHKEDTWHRVTLRSQTMQNHTGTHRHMIFNPHVSMHVHMQSHMHTQFDMPTSTCMHARTHAHKIARHLHACKQNRPPI